MQVKLSKQNPYAPAYLKADVSEKNGGKKKKKNLWLASNGFMVRQKIFDLRLKSVDQ